MITIAGGIILAVLLLATIEFWGPILWWLIKAAFLLTLAGGVVVFVLSVGQY